MPLPARLSIGTEAKQQNNDCLGTDMGGAYVVQVFGILLASTLDFMRQFLRISMMKGHIRWNIT